jgi:hypothetical protein
VAYLANHVALHPTRQPATCYSKKDGAVFSPVLYHIPVLNAIIKADLEDLVLSGKLFNGGSHRSSPRRSPSPDAVKWPNDADYDSEQENNIRSGARNKSNLPQQESIGMGPGRTGVKGVIRDRNEANSNARLKQANDVEEMNRRMERASLGGKTFLEEERERLAEKALIEGVSRVQDPLFTQGGASRTENFGHLREVGFDGFLRAIEAVERGVWVIIHIYDPVCSLVSCFHAINIMNQSLERCIALDDSLGRLARQYPSVKFLRAKASVLGFTSTSTTSNKRSSFSSAASRITKSAITPGRYLDDDDDDDDDPCGDENEDEDNEGGEDEDKVDTDMLPTLLVYQDGDLIHNWVRIDWEAGTAGIEDFLERYAIEPLTPPPVDV